MNQTQQTPAAAQDYVCSVWFERDRKQIDLSTTDGRTLVHLVDEDVDDAIESGYLRAPRGPLMSSRALNNDAAWKPMVVQYARDMGLIN